MLYLPTFTIKWTIHVGKYTSHLISWWKKTTKLSYQLVVTSHGKLGGMHKSTGESHGVSVVGFVTNAQIQTIHILVWLLHDPWLGSIPTSCFLSWDSLPDGTSVWLSFPTIMSNADQMFLLTSPVVFPGFSGGKQLAGVLLSWELTYYIPYQMHFWRWSSFS